MSTKHNWNQTEYKPWTCLACGFYTANLRHIENGFCRHDWGERCGVVACQTCGIFMYINPQCTPKSNLQWLEDAFAEEIMLMGAPYLNRPEVKK
jgi:hypothetical protein